MSDGDKDKFFEALDRAADVVLNPETDIRTLVKRSYENSANHGFHAHDDAIFVRQRQAHLVHLANGTEETAREEAFWDKIVAEHLGNRLMLIVGEVSEAHEEIRAGREPNDIYFEVDGEGKAKPMGYAIELADAFIRLFDEAGARDIDLPQAIAIKMLYNEGRPMMHGKVM